MNGDTIFALSSGLPPSGVAVLRLSGNQVREIIHALTRKPLPAPRKMQLCDIFTPNIDDGNMGDVASLDPRQPHDPLEAHVDSSDVMRDYHCLDRCLLVYFNAPNSFTGEDMAEFHIHGGLATVEAVTLALQTFPQTRQAEAGEFTRRAFQYGKMDLTAVEGLGDLIQAQSENQRRQALRQADGALSKIYEGWAQRLTLLLAHYEALIDFSEEEIPTNLTIQISLERQSLIDEISNHIQQGMKAQKTRNGLYIAILGAPNVGKSSLLNFLSGHDRAIVSDIAGTTRDALYTPLLLADTPVTMIDTAGLRKTDDVIEKEGILRAMRAANEADLCILMQDARDGKEAYLDTGAEVGIDLDILNRCPSLRLINKIDLIEHNRGVSNEVDFNGGDDDWGYQKTLEEKRNADQDCLAISLKDKIGLEHFMAWLEDWIRAHAGLTKEAVMTRPRHQQALQQAMNALMIEGDKDHDLAIEAEAVREALMNLGRITGKVDIETILDHIFKEFCIGK